MSLFAAIKKQQLQARKDRDAGAASILTTLIGECETLAKNSGHEMTDAQVVAVVKKFIKNIDMTLDALAIEGGEQVMALHKEKTLLEAFLPKQMDEAQLRALIVDFGDQGMKIGDAMKQLKLHYAGQYDGALASKLMKELLQ